MLMPPEHDPAAVASNWAAVVVIRDMPSRPDITDFRTHQRLTNFPANVVHLVNSVLPNSGPRTPKSVSSSPPGPIRRVLVSNAVCDPTCWRIGGNNLSGCRESRDVFESTAGVRGPLGAVQPAS